MYATTADALTSFHIGHQIYLPAYGVYGTLSDFARRRLYIGGRVLKVRKNARVVWE